MRFSVTEPPAHGVPVRALFNNGRTGLTVLLWTVFFMSLVDLYFLSNWLPTVLSDLGASVSAAALIGSMLQIGGLVGTFALGRVIDRFSIGPRKSCSALPPSRRWGRPQRRGC